MKPYDRTLLEIFAAEQAEHLNRLRDLAQALSTESTPASVFNEALRRAHTLKGAARAVGLEITELLAHRLETLIERTRGGAVPPANDAIHHALDAIEDVLASVLANREEPDTAGILNELDGLLGGVPIVPPAAGTPAVDAPPPSPGPLAEFVRVKASDIDDLIRSASQILAAGSTESVAAQEADGHLSHAEDAFREFLRLRKESGARARESLERLGGKLRTLLAEARKTARWQQQRSWNLQQRAAELHQNVVRVRMIPAESVFGAFGAMVRELAHQESKEVEFRAEGFEVQADRLVLQALKDPVMHLLRNAVSHGIESPHNRLAAGKSAAGLIRLRIESNGDRLHVTVEDDGRGLDLKAVAAEATRRGLLTHEELASHTPEEISQLILQPGFTTSKVITNLYGRGMGLSVVEQTVAQLQGEVEVRPRGNTGLQIAIAVAHSISTLHVLLVAAGGFTFGLPTRSVKRLCRIRVSEIQTVGGREVLVLDAQPVPLARLEGLLALKAQGTQGAVEEGKDRMLSIAVVTSDEQTIGLVVDRCLDDRAAVIKELGLPPSMAGMTTGGLALDDGTVAPLLNPAALFDRFAESANWPALQKRQEEAPKPAPRILIVDDSMTTRSLEKSILEAHGYRVQVAVDGLEALDTLAAEPFDLVITDVMMPRMDGLQLIEQMKKRKETEQIPVIIVTSLERPEDQKRGLSLGADAYIVKRKFDQRELIETVRQIL